jgi:hypothetical protein
MKVDDIGTEVAAASDKSGHVQRMVDKIKNVVADGGGAGIFLDETFFHNEEVDIEKALSEKGIKVKIYTVRKNKPSDGWYATVSKM